MNKKFLNCYTLLLCLVWIFSAVPGNLNAQEQKHFYCGHDLLMESNEKMFPGYKENIRSHFNLIQSKIHDNEFRSSSDEILKIPVVVHVVWKNDEENLSDELIQSQINVLNEDFRLLNPDKDSIRDIFKARQADAGIEFELTMVKRVKTNSNFNLSLTGLVDNVKRPSNGGSKAEDTQKFMNIWVCKIQPIPFIGGQILGYAYPPSGLDNWPDGTSAPSPDLDGVVIDYRAFGKGNPFPVEVNGITILSEGRTTTHEVGHYLGLRHIWGDGGGIFGGLSCNEDDGIPDTPNQGRQSPFDCNKGQNSCIETSDDEPDMVENFMDYSDQLCQNSFTKGQVEHMRMALQTKRSGLLSSLSYNPINDAQIQLIPNPATDLLKLVLSDHWKVGELTCTISEIDGMMAIHKTKLNSSLVIEEISQLRPGLYIITISDGIRTVKKKFIKL